MSIINLDEKEQNHKQEIKESQDIQIEIITFDLHDYTYYIIKGKDKLDSLKSIEDICKNNFIYQYKEFTSLGDLLLLSGQDILFQVFLEKFFSKANDIKTALKRLRFLKQFCHKSKHCKL
ncbi:unnamed protein product [Paramecium sonneborni]|uniref:Uncharacterized protein n=1 Tax=Paramecium sonneborni TaxID=65129 RepID=A0A8S1KK29_9CILI|nr:unnamed protein product [Paramecium sonneborni]